MRRTRIYTRTITDLPGIWIDVMSLADDLAGYRNKFTCSTNQTTGIKEINMPRAWVEYYFQNAESRTSYIGFPQLQPNTTPTPEQEGEKVRKLKLLHKGDLIQYPNSAGVSHVSVVHSDRSSCSTNSSVSCAYEIIHAYGGDCSAKEKDGSCKQGSYSRKVLKTKNKFATFPDPTGFGRVKLWD